MEEEIDRLLKQWAEIIDEKVKNKWAEKAGKIQGNADTHGAIVKQIYDGMAVTLGFSGQKAWVLEYGRGSLMDSSNPWYDDYEGSTIFNPVRRGNYITGRPPGVYYDLDGTPYYSKGTKEGEVLENQSPIFAPSEPMYIIQNEIEDFLGDPERTNELSKIFDKIVTIPEKISIEL